MKKTKIFNLVIVVLMFSIQTFCAASVYLGHRGFRGNITLDLGGVVPFIYLITILHIKTAFEYWVANCLWTVGFYIIFQNNYTTISGAILVAIACWVRQNQIKNKD